MVYCAHLVKTLSLILDINVGMYMQKYSLPLPVVQSQPTHALIGSLITCCKFCVGCDCTTDKGKMYFCKILSLLKRSKVHYRFYKSLSLDLATGWTVRGSNPGGGEIFGTRPDRPWGLPSLLYNGYRVIPGGKAAGAWR